MIGSLLGAQLRPPGRARPLQLFSVTNVGVQALRFLELADVGCGCAMGCWATAPSIHARLLGALSIAAGICMPYRSPHV